MRSLGDDCIEVPVASVAAAQKLASELRGRPEFLHTVAGLASVAVQFDLTMLSTATAVSIVNAAIESPSPVVQEASAELTITVRYDGPDLDAVCGALHVSVDEFVAIHCSAEHSVDMLGFTPGFAYLSNLGPEYDIARLASPRQHVAAGSVGFAGGRTGLYALAGPGGWPLIGRTADTLFDADAGDPFLIQPGMTVRFVPIA